MNVMSSELSNKFRNVGFVCALLVVAIHVGKTDIACSAAWWMYEIMGGGLSACAVPFFFLASGYFAAKDFDEKGYWGTALAKRVKSLLVPFVLWSVVFFVEIVFLRGMQNLMHGEPFGWRWAFTSNALFELSGLNPFVMPTSFPLWFVRSLFVIFLILPMFEYLSRTWLRFLLGLAFGVACMIAVGGMQGNWNGLFRFTVSVEGAVYFLAGAFLRRHNLPRPLPRCVLVLCGAGAIAAVMSCAFFAASGVVVPKLVQIILIPFEMLGLWGIVPASVWPAWLTGSSFAVFLIHVPLLSVLNVLVVWIGRWMGTDITLYALTSACEWVLACALSVGVAHLLFRLCPHMSAVLFGGRLPGKR